MCAPAEGFLEVSYDGSSNYVRVAGLTNININRTLDKNETTTFDSGVYKTYRKGRVDIGISFDLERLYDDNGQKIMAFSLRNQVAEFYFRVGLVETLGAEVFYGRGFLESATDSRGVGEEPKGSYAIAPSDIVADEIR